MGCEYDSTAEVAVAVAKAHGVGWRSVRVIRWRIRLVVGVAEEKQ